jgi:hypothetical protein
MPTLRATRRRALRRPLRLGACLAFAAGVLSGCTLVNPTPTPSATSPTPAVDQAVTGLPADATTIVDGSDSVALALGASRSLFHSAPAVVLTSADDADDLTTAVTTAVSLGVPLLLIPAATTPAGTAAPTVSVGPTAAAVATGTADAVATEVTRLAATTEVTVGTAADTWAHTAQSGATSMTIVASTGALPSVHPAQPLTDLLVLALDGPASQAAAATAKAAGARVLIVKDADPRADSDAIHALTGQQTSRILALGGAFGPADRLRDRVETAATGVELPGGGQILFPGRRMVALYGHPGDTVLGALGEQPLDQAVVRAKKVASDYDSLVDVPVIPTFEIITTVASASAGADGDYSSETPISVLQPWIDAARAAGMYVVLDLQPGRTDFLTQAKRYTDLLVQPNVGLALDPEWRLKPNQVHMVQIGSVQASEINATSAWLDELTRSHHLPQKLLILHQFRLDMIVNRSTLVMDHDSLRILIHVDGFGTAGEKMNTWNALHVNAPAGVWWGWKNFYDEDKPTFTPAQTVAISPSPVFVSYQ